ncbi:hypothetical protein FACS1894178_1070 [Bacteroidia bacterium]|nr:hypothetical protein FACS1894178_1070 [Bacteroidia bacterium]
MKIEKLFVKDQHKINVIRIKNITHISCSGYVCTIHTQSTQFIVSKLLKEFEIEFAESNFIRINHSTLVNLEYVENIEIGTNYLMNLSTGISLKISRRKIQMVEKLLKSQSIKPLTIKKSTTY